MPIVFHRSSVIRGLEDSAKDRAELAQMRRKMEATDLLVGWKMDCPSNSYSMALPSLNPYCIYCIYILYIYIYIKLY